MIKIHLKRSSLFEEEKINLLDKVKQNFDQYKDFYWVFFDTETTGTDPETDQITEFAAIAVDSDFSNRSEPLIHDVLHRKVFLREGMEITKTKSGSKDSLSRSEVASMTKMGAPKDAKKAKRKGVKQYNPSDYVEESEMCSLVDNFLKNLQSKKNVILVAHNIRFDLKFVKKAFQLNNMVLPKYPTLDTVALARDYYLPLLRLAEEKDLVSVYDKLFSMTEIEMIMKGTLTKRLGHLASALDIDAENWHSAIDDVKMLIAVAKVIFSHLEKYGASYQLEEEG